LPDAAFGDQHTWLAHTVVGALFTIVGMAAWSRRRRRPKTPE
ncbi:MAG: hypothetical protein QOG42_2688, partial [Solirubrobacteraceae bacterium]|nr:hypothetical protein [Solirubrobacteraceae bacterium]